MNLLEIYKKLYLIRKSEELIIKHYKEDEMKTPMHMSMGEEAIVVGVISALQRDDLVFGTYRSHALFLAKTDDTDKFLAELYGKATGSQRGKAGSMHLALPEKGVITTSAVVGTTIPVAAGAALANKFLKNKKITVSFFGDGAIDEGVFWESLNFASLKKLPILFVCEDNNLAIHSAVNERWGHEPLVEVASRFYCHVKESDTTDVFEIYKITREMIGKMKRTKKPGLLHLKYYRYLEHVGVADDFNFGYRSKNEFLNWKRIDPMHVARKHLLKAGIKENAITEIEKKIDKKLSMSIEKAKKAPYPNDLDLFDNEYA